MFHFLPNKAAQVCRHQGAGARRRPLTRPAVVGLVLLGALSLCLALALLISP
jgi:hypothetical protein